MINHVYYVYKTINKHNSKYYIGVHRTNNVNDGYMGCGHYRGRKLRESLDTGLYRAFRKYGDDAFTTEVLYIFENEIDAYNKEKELIDIKDKSCYNDKPGGIGGFHPDTNKGRVFTESERKKMSEAAKIRSKQFPLQTETLKEYNKWREGKTYAEIYGEEKGKEVSLKRSKSLTGRKLSDEHKRKMSENRKGKDCGKCKGRVGVWNTSTKKGMRISRDILELEISEGNIIEQLFIKNKFCKFKFTKIK